MCSEKTRRLKKVWFLIVVEGVTLMLTLVAGLDRYASSDTDLSYFLPGQIKSGKCEVSRHDERHWQRSQRRYIRAAQFDVLHQLRSVQSVPSGETSKSNRANAMQWYHLRSWESALGWSQFSLFAHYSGALPRRALPVSKTTQAPLRADSLLALEVC